MNWLWVLGWALNIPCITAVCWWHILHCPHRYIHQPLLLEGKKFDVRSYLLIACTAPYVLFFAQGYVRLTCTNYDAMSDDLTVHLTNQVNQVHLAQKKGRRDYREGKQKKPWKAENMPCAPMKWRLNRSSTLCHGPILCLCWQFPSLDLFLLAFFSHISVEMKPLTGAT